MTNANLTTLEILRKAKTGLFNNLCDASTLSESVDLMKLRADPVFYLCEFLYMISQFDFKNEDFFKTYIENHNAYIQALIEDREKHTSRLGLNRQRLESGLFSPRSMEKSLANFRMSRGAIDQSDLSRFMIAILSPETTRRTVEILSLGGLISRDRSPFGSVLIQSSGVIEATFGQYLSECRTGIQNQFSS
ncbi:hypothetical protein [Roseibium sp. SCP14]|uniref:hypothetical protein n=1 Tax=Roseibium sp. SCP14 TaxID=3141375 RepID=UPI003336569C